MKNKIDKKVLFSIIIGIILSIFTNVVAETLINSKDVSYVDNSKLGATNVQAAIDGTCTKFSNELSNFLDKIYPIGSIYISTANTNPSTFLGGTWENYADGRVLKGIKSGTAGTTGGSSTVTLSMSNIPAHTHTYDKANANTDSHTLTIDEMPSHTHIQNSHYHGTDAYFTGWSGWEVQTAPAGIYVLNSSVFGNSNGSTFTGNLGGGRLGITSSNVATNQYTGGSQGHNHPISTTSTNTGSAGSSNPTAISVQDPYVTVYMWRRTK